MCISFASITYLKRFIADSTMAWKVSQSIAEIWRVTLAFNQVESVCFLYTHNLSRIPTIRSHRNSNPENEIARLSEKFSNLLDHLQTEHKAVPSFLELCEMMHHHACIRLSLNILSLVRMKWPTAEDGCGNGYLYWNTF